METEEQDRQYERKTRERREGIMKEKETGEEREEDEKRKKEKQEEEEEGRISVAASHSPPCVH